jgi:hypothetical protein
MDRDESLDQGQDPQMEPEPKPEPSMGTKVRTLVNWDRPNRGTIRPFHKNGFHFFQKRRDTNTNKSKNCVIQESTSYKNNNNKRE